MKIILWKNEGKVDKIKNNKRSNLGNVYNGVGSIFCC